jgi:SAM-dependent methyltransferase
MLDRARAQVPGVDFVQGDGERFDLGGRAFDAVFSNAALHWMLRPAEALACVRRALRPGGRFVGEMGGAGNVAVLREALEQARRAAGAPARAAPWFFPSIATYARLLEEAGFEPRTMALFDRPTRLEGIGEQAAAAWYQMFSDRWLDDLEAEVADRVVQHAAAAACRRLERDGLVWADYRRLRFVAAG